MDNSTYWKSLRELHDGSTVSELKAHEFMDGVTDDFDITQLSPMSRKQFLALLTASAAVVASGCTNYRDKGEIVPYTRKPEEITPGVSNYYASTCCGCSQACGILIKTREGRPIKIDGNPDHPVNRGKTCATGQATIMNLYDPYRLRKPVFGSQSGKTGEISWNQIDETLIQHLHACVQASREIALIIHPTQSPTFRSLLQEFTETYPTARIYSYELFPQETARRAWELSYGVPELPVIAWEKADIILALESDFLGTEGNTLEQIRAFARRRDVMQSTDFNRLYCVEGDMSLTAANADYRLRLRPDFQLEFLLGLINEITTVRKKSTLDPRLVPSAGGVSLASVAREHGLAWETLTRLVDDLLAHRGKSLVIAGHALPEEVHIAVNYLNEILDNGTLFQQQQAVAGRSGLTTPEEWRELIARMQSGAVGMIVHVDTNPAYHLPIGMGYGDALKSVPLSVSLTESENESSPLVTYVLPAHHAFESWGDFNGRNGLYSLQQPVIAPLYQTRQKEAVLLHWMSGKGQFQETVYHEYLKAHWEKEVFPAARVSVDFNTFWYSSLHDGVVQLPAKSAESMQFNARSLEQLKIPSGHADIVIMLTRSHYIGDGRHANNGWLQEIPHPVSKVVWDNYAAISTTTARNLDVQDGSILDVSIDNRRVKLPVFVQAGLADQLVCVSLGYGRWNAGPVGSGVGANVNILLGIDGMTSTRLLAATRVTRAAGRYELSSTQEHHSLDDAFLKDMPKKRGIVQEGTLLEYAANPGFLQHEKHELTSISKEVEYPGLKWAMAIDMNKCVGCNACVSGCNVENNIPVVGKEQVMKGREMQWIRIDRYYSGTQDDPSLSHQPMLCQHCDHAPCENVCPVVATTHSADGLNQMTYNRCVGTKYCSNNCPYKVRRFNFFNWRDNLADGYYEQQPLSLMHNPEVTVRSRGVMEKCSFCVQRIMEARQHAAEQGRPVKGSDVTTACQQVCPAEAIVFGDVNDPDSEVAKYRAHKLGYHILEEVNARPNVTYIARLRNTHPEKSS